MNMPEEQLSEEDRARLIALEMKKANGGVGQAEESEMFDLRKKKKLQQVLDGNDR